MALTISHRCQNIAPSLTLQIDTRAKEMAASGMDVVGFGAGEPDFPTPAHICDAAREALDLGMTHYTAVPGTMELRMAITRKMERDHGLTYSPRRSSFPTAPSTACSTCSRPFWTPATRC